MTAKAKADDAPANDAPPSTAPHVIRAIAGISAALAAVGIAKDRTPQDGPKFQYRGVDQVMNALAPLLVEHRMTITPRCLARTSEPRKTSTGKDVTAVTVDVEYEFRSAVDGSALLGRMFGEAADSGDKGTNKALSAAYKYMAFQTFCIPTEGDGDTDADSNHHDLAPRDQQRQQDRREPIRDGKSASVTAAEAQIMLLETEDACRKWVDDNEAFIQKLDEAEHKSVVATWKARVETVRGGAAQHSPDALAKLPVRDQVVALGAYIDACQDRDALDRWTVTYKPAVDKLQDGDYKSLSQRWKARHAALAPKREGFK